MLQNNPTLFTPSCTATSWVYGNFLDKFISSPLVCYETPLHIQCFATKEQCIWRAHESWWKLWNFLHNLIFLKIKWDHKVEIMDCKNFYHKKNNQMPDQMPLLFAECSPVSLSLSVLKCHLLFETLQDLVDHINDFHVKPEKDSGYCCQWEGCARNGRGFNARYWEHAIYRLNNKILKICMSCLGQMWIM